MVKTYRYVEPDENMQSVEVTFTEAEIIGQYYPQWCERMMEAGVDPSFIREDNCIDNWVMGNWAWEVMDEDI